MRKISNPYRKIPGYNCFGCSPDNKQGLRMEFYEEGDEIISVWDPAESFQGYLNILHGGIQSTLMDEIACWVVLVKLKTGGVTARMDVQYKKPVYSDKGKITLKAKLKNVRMRLAEVSVDLLDHNGELGASGKVWYYIYPKDEAVKSLSFPEDHSEFFTE